MKLSDLEFIRLLPVFMKKEEDNQALAKAMDLIFRDPNKHLQTISTWSQIENLLDDELNELAYELDIDWYDSGSDRQTKISQIKSALKVKKRRGTRWSVEQILSDVFGQAYVREWYEFDGEPYTFEVAIKDPITTQDEYDRMVTLINKGKNIRSRMVQAYLLHEYKATIGLESKHHEGDFPVVMCGLKNCGQIPTDTVRDIERCGSLLCGHRAVVRPQIVSGLFLCGEEYARI